MTDELAMAPLFTITSQVETYDRNAAGAFVTGVQVTFRTRTGATASVFVPYDQLQAERVRELVTIRARELEAIAQLGMEG
jgi:hypothetical protein